MSTKNPARLIRIGAFSVIAGELVALASQLDVGPTPFVVFIVGGGTLTVGGALLALFGVLRSPASSG